MLRRAFWFIIAALLAAIAGQSELLGTAGLWAWRACYVAGGFALLSLLLSLFEEVPEAGTADTQLRANERG